jgi:hypothetical protein
MEVWLLSDTIKDQMKSKIKEFKEMAWEDAKIIKEFMLGASLEN